MYKYHKKGGNNDVVK